MNRVRAQVAFSFKGDNHEVNREINLDEVVVEDGGGPDFHLILARAAGIDTYSYLYEVFASEGIRFCDASGVAALCCHDGNFDWACYVAQRNDQGRLQVLGEIARTHLGLTDLAAHTEIRNALLAAFRAGGGNG